MRLQPPPLRREHAVIVEFDDFGKPIQAVIAGLPAMMKTARWGAVKRSTTRLRQTDGRVAEEQGSHTHNQTVVSLATLWHSARMGVEC